MDATDDVPITTSVPVYGQIVFGLGRYGSYEAAKPGGKIPIIEVQNKSACRGGSGFAKSPATTLSSLTH